MLLRAVPVGGGLHRLHERDQQGEDDRGGSPTCGARGMLQRVRRRPPSGAGAALQTAEARGAGGLLERAPRRADAVTDQDRGVLGSHRQEVTEGGGIARAFGLPGGGVRVQLASLTPTC
ncbi:hypothetical protein [Streptomyces yangpuensis]|uniref:hypothetical protein n=1 Tax=Streptomyces yangpuensis TaxID=1648182 RepID=UPI00371E9195